MPEAKRGYTKGSGATTRVAEVTSAATEAAAAGMVGAAAKTVSSPQLRDVQCRRSAHTHQLPQRVTSMASEG